MFEVNKKLWSLIFGCLFACSLVGLVNLGNMAPVLSIFHAYPEFIFDYYSHMVTAIVAIVMTLIMMMIMRKVFRLCTSEHTFWLILPMLYFIALTVFAAQAMLIGLLFAALPIIMILAGAAVYFRLGGLKSNQSVLLS